MMTSLPNPSHEAFARGFASGKSAAAAYVDAGYTADRGNAATLKANQNIKVRVKELLAEATKKTTDAISFGAVDLFTRFENDIRLAQEAGDHPGGIQRANG